MLESMARGRLAMRPGATSIQSSSRRWKRAQRDSGEPSLGAGQEAIVHQADVDARERAQVDRFRRSGQPPAPAAERIEAPARCRTPRARADRARHARCRFPPPPRSRARSALSVGIPAIRIMRPAASASRGRAARRRAGNRPGSSRRRSGARRRAGAFRSAPSARPIAARTGASLRAQQSGRSRR